MSTKRSVTSGFVNSDIRIDGKTALITGANTGIGYETALDLARRGAKIILACRDLGKAEEAKRKILQEVKAANVIVKKLNLASLSSVKQCALDVINTEAQLHLLINNAGLMACPPSKTEDGFEMHLGVNHIGHFLLTELLLDLLKKSAPSRIVIVSALAYKATKMQWNDIMYEKYYHAIQAYCQSKLANVHHCLELSRRLEGTGVTCNVLHPGVIISTELGRHFNDISHLPFRWRILIKCLMPFARFSKTTPRMGAQTTIYCATAPALGKTSGKYYDNCAEQALTNHALDEDDAKKLWKLSEEWVQEYLPPKTETQE